MKRLWFLGVAAWILAAYVLIGGSGLLSLWITS